MVGDLARDPPALLRRAISGEIKRVDRAGSRRPRGDRGRERAVDPAGETDDEGAATGVVEGLAQGERQRPNDEVGVERGDAVDLGRGRHRLPPALARSRDPRLGQGCAPQRLDQHLVALDPVRRIRDPGAPELGRIEHRRQLLRLERIGDPARVRRER